MGGHWITYFYALKFSNVAIGMLSLYTFPVMTALLEPFFIKVKLDPERLRPADVTLQIPCVDKFKKATGWNPHINFDTTLIDTLNFWRDYWRKRG